MKKFFIPFFLFFFCTTLLGQKFSATVNKNPVGINETFQLQFSVDGPGSGFQAPSLSDFDVISGPNPSQSVQIVNGNMYQSISYSYYLRPKKEGKFTIGPASINLGSKRVESNTLVIEVNKGGGGSSGGNQGGGSKNQATRSGGDNLFVKATLSKSKVYQGEMVLLSYKVYARVNLVAFQGEKVPSYTGFWTQTVPNPSNFSVSREVVNGVAYSVVDYKKVCLFPQRSGTLNIDPIEIEPVVREQSRSQDPWGGFFGFSSQDVAYKIKSQPAKIEVLPLPETGKPKDFSGAVGQFSLKASLNKNKVKTNEAINLNVSVSGKGNISLTDPPKITIPPDIESYDPKTSETVSVKATGVDGTKSAEYLLIPRHHGEYKIESVPFSYFDPEKNTYVSLQTPEFSITVEKGEGENSAATTVNPSADRKDIAVIGNDIRYIKTNKVALLAKDNHFYGSFGFWLYYLIPALLFVILIVLLRKYRNENMDLQQVKKRKATKIAQKRLVLALKHMKANEKEPFYEEISKALYGYLGDKLSIQVAELSKESIAETLNKNAASTSTIQELLSTLDACEFARYAPSAASGDLNAIYTNSVDLIAKLENEIKKIKS